VLGIIGEAARHVPDDVAAAHPELPWAEMRAMRNVLVHAYFDVTNETLWKTAARGPAGPRRPAPPTPREFLTLSAEESERLARWLGPCGSRDGALPALGARWSSPSALPVAESASVCWAILGEGAPD